MSHYQERDVRQLDRAGNYFSRHMEAMTSERLDDKAAIAAELAARDQRIDALTIRINEVGQIVSVDLGEPEEEKHRHLVEGIKKMQELLNQPLDVTPTKKAEPAGDFRVYINCRFHANAQDAEHAWRIIGSQPFGSGHEVRDADNQIRAEFVPY